MNPLLTDGELAKMEQTLAQFHRASGLLYVHPPHDLSIGEQDSLLADARWHRKALAEARAENARLRSALACVLPMAKGYAYANPVGRNAEMIAEAEADLARAEGKDAK